MLFCEKCGLTLIHCTISGNSTGNGNRGGDARPSSRNGGNGGDGGHGGGIYSNSGGDLAITHCTISSNSTGDGGDGGTAGSNGAQGSLGSGGRGAGVNDQGGLLLNNTLISGNLTGDDPLGNPGTGPDLSKFSGSFTGSGVNFIGDLTGSGQSPSGTLLNGDAMLAPLGDYGGPTQTMLPLASSPVIDPAGGNTTSPYSTDQRGLNRIFNSIVDIGAVEYVAPPVIYESFDDPDSTLTGNTPGTGFSGNWFASASVEAGSLLYGKLLAGTGNKVSASNQYGGVSIGTTLSDAGLLNDGEELWFSVLIRMNDENFPDGDFGFVLGTDRITNGNNVAMTNGGKGMGATFRNMELSASHWAPALATSFGAPTDPNRLYLVVARFTWGTTEDTVEIYNVGKNLVLGLPVSTYTTASNVDQSLFDTVSFGSDALNSPHLIDEIRFGATSADVLPVDTTPPALVAMVDNVSDGPIYEDVVALTYTVTFDQDIDGSTVTAGDFDVIGTGGASAMIGTVTQVDTAVFEVQVLPTGTGTLQLRIPIGATITDWASDNLDVSAALLDDTIITINAGTTPETGIRYWDGPIASGITDGASGGGNGLWDTTTTNWDKGVGFAGPMAWNNANLDTARLGGTAGTLTLDDAITTAGITSSADYTISGANTLNFAVTSGTPVINVSSGTTLTIDSLVAGNDGLQKVGEGTLHLSGNNTFAGGVTLNAGILIVDSESPYSGWGTGTLTINGGRIKTKSGGGSFTTSNDSAWNAPIILLDQVAPPSPGPVVWNHQGNIVLGTNVALNNLKSSWTTVVDGAISETGGSRNLELGGINLRFTLNGINTYTGTTSIGSNGRLEIGGSGQLGSGNYSANIINNGNVFYSSSANQILSGNISGTGQLFKNASNSVLTLTGTNTYTGATMISAGTLALVGGSQTSAITLAGASLGFTLGSGTSSTASVDLTNGTVKITGTPTLSSYLLMTASSITGTPVLDSPFPGYELVKENSDTELRLTFTYAAWASTNAPTGNPDDDYDGDGVSNALEFVLGGLASTNDLDRLPEIATSGGDMTFTFVRDQSCVGVPTAVTIEVGTDLSDWSMNFPVPDADTGGVVNPGVTVVAGADTDTVTFTVPLAPDTKKFARLKVVIP